LPLQKVLNANISLIDRYHRSAIPRRFALEPYIDTQLLNSQSNDPAKVSPFDLQWWIDHALDPSKITFVENVPQANDALF